MMMWGEEGRRRMDGGVCFPRREDWQSARGVQGVLTRDRGDWDGWLTVDGPGPAAAIDVVPGTLRPPVSPFRLTLNSSPVANSLARLDLRLSFFILSAFNSSFSSSSIKAILA